MTTITPSNFDTKSFGEVVQLSVPNGPSITIVEKGLHVAAITFKDKNGLEHDIVPGGNDPAQYVDEKSYRHCLIGRTANRLPSETPISLPGSDEKFTLPSYPLKGHNLHGGPVPFGWDEKVLSRVELGKSQLFSPKEISFLQGKDSSAGVWSLTSPDGEGGHIGTVYVEIAFAVLESKSAGEVGQIIVVYRAKLLDKPATTLNLTHHWGFNLSASAISQGKPVPATDIGITEHHLKLKSKNILNLDPDTFLPTGTLLPLSTPSAKEKDFSGEGKSISKIGEGYPQSLTSGDRLGQGFPGVGYDDFWLFDREKKEIVVPEAKKDELDVFGEIAKDEETLATLSSARSGLALTFTSNQPGLQAWSGGDTFDGSTARKTIHGGKNTRGTNDGYTSDAPPALAMEFHGIYGAWLYPELDGLGWNTVLKKGEIYNNWVRMSIQSK